jgi:hypothetical protein
VSAIVAEISTPSLPRATQEKGNKANLKQVNTSELSQADQLPATVKSKRGLCAEKTGFELGFFTNC